MQTRGAMGYLLGRYRAVLRKCRLLNVFGTLAMAAMLAGTGTAQAASSITESATITADTTVTMDAAAESSSSRLAGIIAEGGEIAVSTEDGATLTITNSESSTSGQRFYGAAVTDGGSLALDGSLVFDLAASEDSMLAQQAAALHLEGGSLTAEGSDIDASASGYYAYGVEAGSNSDVSFTDGTTDIEISTTYYGAGISAQDGSSVTLSGTISVTANGDSADDVSGIQTGGGGEISIDGDVTVKLTGSATYMTGVWGSSSGTEASSISFSGALTQIIIDADSSWEAYGVSNYNSHGTTMTFDADETVISVTNRTTDSGDWTLAYMGHQSTTTITGSASITVDGGAGDAFGVNLQCDYGNTYDTLLTFSGETTSVEVSSANSVRALYSSGGPATLSFTNAEGTVSVKATSTGYYACGIVAQY
ncbi:MAG: hypothetical protein Q4F72_05480, partial [Desulfovibrionaceae bacterium]|nr:hypothetical protein [Desulfovibrionaceae bacterium]